MVEAQTYLHYTYLRSARLHYLAGRINSIENLLVTTYLAWDTSGI